MLSSQTMRDEEVEDLAGLESSVARKDTDVEGVEEQSSLKEDDAKGPTAAGTSARV